MYDFLPVSNTLNEEMTGRRSMRRKCAGGRRVEGPTVVYRPDPPYSYMTRQLTLP